MSARVGIIGLGVMGAAMAKNLLAADHEVLGFDLAPHRRQIATDAGVSVLANAAAVAKRADTVVFSLPTVEALAAVADEVAANAHAELLCLETGTFPLVAKFSARDVLAAAGIELMDTALSGTGLQAADGTLVVFASGTPEAFERAQPVFRAIGRSTHYLGEFGNGSRMKYIANLLVTIHNLATAEAHVLGMAAGMDPAVVQEVMEDGVGSSKIFEIRGPMMVAGDYPAAARLDIILKDARIIEDFAQSVGAPTPLLDAALEVYTRTSAAGMGDFDAAVLFEYLRNQAGLER
ncbi:MAG: NAD(P)-dependent oxidoreductase [Acidimicrobiia bacterium]